MDTRRASGWREVGFFVLLGLPPLLAALSGASGPFSLRLGLGPWDGPYLEGFARDLEINDKVATRWTTYQATVHLPLEIEGPRIGLAYRYSRVLPQTAVVRVVFGGRTVDEFKCRGGGFAERHVSVVADRGTPATIELRIDSHDRKNLGLNLDSVEIASDRQGRRRLTGTAILRPALVVALIALLLRLGGWGRRMTALLAAPWSLAATIGLLRDPWLIHRLGAMVPEALCTLGLLMIGLGQLLVARKRLAKADLRALAALGLLAFLLRMIATNHPDFYYPDLMTHARLVREIQKAGIGFWFHPSHLVFAQGAWTKPAYGGMSGLPYAVGFHSLFVLWPLSYDALLAAQKTVGAFLTVIPLLALWATARGLGISPLGAVLMVLIPTYTSRLSFALLPAITGHAMDMLLIAWLAHFLPDLSRRRVFWSGAVLVAACQLTYVSSVTNVALLLACLAVLVAWEASHQRLQVGARVLGLGLAASALSIALYYRDFLGGAAGLIPRLLGPSGGGSQYPVESWFALTYVRTRDFFDGVYPLLTVGGLVLLWIRRRGRALLLAWLMTYFLLLFLRAKIPDVFRYGHETLMVTPLVCLASGEALAEMARRGRHLKLVAGGLLVGLAIQGLIAQWIAVADQLSNAL